MYSKIPEKTTKKQFNENRKAFKQYPLCLKHTLLTDESINKVRNAPLAASFFIADELKAEGNLYYEDKDYYAAIELYDLVLLLSTVGLLFAPVARIHLPRNERRLQQKPLHISPRQLCEGDAEGFGRRRLRDRDE